jgi:type IV pilus assembly protein PilA
MLHAIRKRMQDEKGFTLIELLVVILIIGILAAIAIPSFISQKSKANDAAAKSYVRNLQTAEETYFTDNNTYTTTFATLKTIEPVLADTPAGTDPSIVAVTDITKDYKIGAISKAGVTYYITRAADGTTTRTCDKVNVGGCPSSGSW